jgi:putative membrane protein
VWLHVSGNLCWIGASAATGVALIAPTADVKARGAAAVAVHRRVATPAFLVSTVCGTARLAMSARLYLVEHHWMHGKLLCALGVVALHHILGARAKQAAGGGTTSARNIAILTATLVLAAVGAAFFAIVRLPN